VPPYPHLSPASFLLPGDDVGVLLLHGITGSPTELRHIGAHLHGLGRTVYAPLLAGHGTHHHDLALTTWRDWLVSAQQGLAHLRTHSRRIVVVGQSMGGLLALHMGAHDVKLAGVVGLAPALIANPLLRAASWVSPVLRHVDKREEQRNDLVDKSGMRDVWSYSHLPTAVAPQLLELQGVVRTSLPSLRVPLLVVQGARDRTVLPRSGQRVIDLAGSLHKELVMLPNSGHIIGVDAQKQDAAEAIARFMAARVVQ
jgi:carboxylesterase